MDGIVPFTVMIRIILFYFGKCRIVSDLSRASDLLMVLDGIEDLIDGELERSEVLCRLEGLEWTWQKN